MFAVIYQSYIKPEAEIEYQRLWKKIANYFIRHRGALGSCLHKTEEGIWLAYSNKLPPVLQPLIEKYTPIAICMDEFYRKLQTESKNTPFPETEHFNLLISL